MWFRWAFPIRVWQRSTAVCCFRPRWYSSIPQARSAKPGRAASPITRSLVIQCSVSPSVATIRNAFTGPNPSRWTTVPVDAMVQSETDRLPVRSGFTRRLLRTWVGNTQPCRRTALRLSRPEYRQSKHTHDGANPRPAAVAGESQDALRVTFFASEEFFNGAGRNNSQFINNLYTQILQQSPSIAETNYRVGVLGNSNGDRTFVARQLLTGAEYYRYEASYAYTNLLHRQPDNSGLTYWSNQRANGMTFETMDVNFLASVEYFNR